MRAVSEDEHIVDYAARRAALRAQVATGGKEALMLAPTPRSCAASPTSSTGSHVELGQHSALTVP